MLLNLPKMSRAEAQLQNLALQCSSETKVGLSWLTEIQTLLSKLVHTNCTLTLAQTSVVATPELTGSFFTVTWPPKSGFFWIECETKIFQKCAYLAIETPSVPENLDPKLSNLETGIVKYLLTRLLETTQESFEIIDSKEFPKVPLFCLSFKLLVGDRNSYVRLWASTDLLESLVSESVTGSALELGKTRAILAKIPLRIELAKISVTPEEVKNLEPGDVVILEDYSSRAVDGFLGEPACAILKGSLNSDETTGRYSFSILDISAIKELS